MAKYVYDFAEGDKSMRSLLGGKGANLGEMTKMGLPVPPGFTISTQACNDYAAQGSFPQDLWDQTGKYLGDLEKRTGKQLGNPEDPLLVSVRSGAAFSMPGMMDTVLNLGLNDESVKGLMVSTDDKRFSYDSYRRFIQMYGHVVLGIDEQEFEDALVRMKTEKGVVQDTDLDADDLVRLVEDFKRITVEETGSPFPGDPVDQLNTAIKAVFESWNNQRARVYRRAHNIADDLGTAANIQTMVFGNKKGVSATGVAFTRNPATGENKLYGEFLLNAQGEDVVAGIRTPEPIEQMKEEMPDIHAQLVKVAESLERHYRDVQDIEFTVEQGQFYVLQTRAGKRTAAAAVKIAADMVEEGLITKEEAVGRLDPEQLDHLLHPQIDPSAEYKVLAKGLAASPGAATGKVVFDADKAESLGKDGEKVILARWETTPDDIHGIIESQGILTSHGGLTSHAAVVARGMGKPCVSGCEEVKIEKETFTVNGALVEEGDVITIDGTNGSVIGGAVELIQPELSQDLEQILKWADGIRRMKVRTNAELPADAEKARAFGAEGIGLCRTEHMFFAEDRLPIVRKMILSEKEDDRRRELDKLLPVQRQDFESLFEVMKGLPVNVRLLDPPLHEFLPDLTELQIELAEMKRSGAAEAEIKKKALLVAQVRSQVEANPMLGLRGCRLGLVHPEIYEMQVRAIMEAACNVAKAGDPPEVEIMIPLVSHYNELKSLRGLVEAEIQKVMKECGQDVPHTIGTMIEIPRAALTADMVADYADFFSFGTNDLTQTTFGFSRDDAEAKFLFFYLDERVLPDNPFEVLDADGVGALVRTAAELGRKTRPGLKLGICGEHGGEPRSISFCEEVGLDYVSCSPYRVPLARLAAAQAVLGESARDK